MLVELANAYVDALNTGKVPTIANAWDYMCSEENQRALRASMDFIRTESNKFTSYLPQENKIILKQKDAIFKTAEEMFYKGVINGISKDDEKEYLAKLTACLIDNFKQIELKNESISTSKVKKFFEDNFRDVVRQNLRNDKYDSFEDYEKDLEVFKEQFKTQFPGDHFEKVLSEILVKFNDKLLKDLSLIKTRRLELENTTYKERCKRFEEELAGVKQETFKDKARYNEKVDFLETERIKHLSQIEVLNEKLNFAEKDKETKLAMWEEKCKSLEQQLVEKTLEIK